MEWKYEQPNQIGYALAISGTAGTLSALLFFPYIQPRFNNRRLYIFFASFWLAVFSVMPLANVAARTGNGALVWTAVIAILAPVRLASNANMSVLDFPFFGFSVCMNANLIQIKYC